MKTLSWCSEQAGEPVQIVMHLSLQAAQWIAAQLPRDDRATWELESAIAAESSDLGAGKPDQIGDKP